jgi:hypothetical protein
VDTLCKPFVHANSSSKTVEFRRLQLDNYGFAIAAFHFQLKIVALLFHSSG